MKKLALVITLLICQWAQADIMKDFDSLGGNDVLIDRAKKLQPNKNVTVVQNRTVDRYLRNEFSIGYNNIVGGDAYLQTQMLNANYHLHINPRWAVGLSYFSAFNKLSSEGEFLVDADGLIPDVDAPDSGYELVGNFAPIYGKVNMFDLGVIQFDVYALVSYGRIKLQSGDSDTYSLGAGLGLWISQHLSSRFEIRQRAYTAQRFGGTQDMSTTSVGFTFGYIL